MAIRTSIFGAAILSFCLLVISSCSRPAPLGQTNNPTIDDRRIASADVVKATPQPLDITAGGSAETSVKLNIQSGYHVNANPPTFPYLKATELQIPAADGVAVGFFVYPDPLLRTFPFADQPLAVYEGETTLRVNFNASKSATKGAREIAAKLQVQACDDQVCYAPGLIDLSIPVNVR